jgi:hypothetical protein
MGGHNVHVRALHPKVRIKAINNHVCQRTVHRATGVPAARSTVRCGGVTLEATVDAMSVALFEAVDRVV